MLIQFFGFVLISFSVVSFFLSERKISAYNDVSPVTDLFNPLHLVRHCCEQGLEHHSP